ncbi:MAG: 7-cyano-7-deazaguanine synthase QueC [Actinobacteria bacterium]|nr:7-cyano-7-deazaguanine synthase QueC [Actinomycetota bacterium]
MADAKKAVVLLSGGIDSTTTLAVALKEGFECYALSFDYGQRHVRELEAAREMAEKFGAAEHLVIQIDLARIGGSALTDDIPVPKGRSDGDIGAGIPVTYVPARNTIFLSIALAWAEVIGAGEIFIGANTLDYSGYPDCRPEFLEAFEKMASLATRCGVEGEGVKIRAPLIEFSKTEIIKFGCDLGVDFSLTHSCYDPTDDGLACGKCDSCIIRKKGFAGAGIEDPARYAA